ncbi:MAG: dehydratase [Chloroflexi bacterium]|nr:dehydratase [Chloroflexota bacterium]
MAEQVYFEDVKEGDEIPNLMKNCSTQQLVLWAAGSGDFYQIHYDKDFAQSTGLKDIIVHGALKNAFLGQLLHDWAGAQGKVKKFGCDYRGMDDAKQEINCRGVITKKFQENGENIVELDIWTENPEGKKTSPGTGVVTLPSRG